MSKDEFPQEYWKTPKEHTHSTPDEPELLDDVPETLPPIQDTRVVEIPMPEHKEIQTLYTPPNCQHEGWVSPTEHDKILEAQVERNKSELKTQSYGFVTTAFLSGILTGSILIATIIFILLKDSITLTVG